MRRLCLISLGLALALPPVASAQSGSVGLAPSSAPRPLARPEGAATAPDTDAGAIPELATLSEPAGLAVLLRPQARVDLAPGRPSPRPDDVVPQPVSLFLRAAGTPLGVPGGRPAPQSQSVLPLFGGAADTILLTALLPQSPVRRQVLQVPIPIQERRIALGLSVSPETAALSGLILSSVNRARETRAAAAGAVAPEVAPEAVLSSPPRPLARSASGAPIDRPRDAAPAARPAVRPVPRPVDAIEAGALTDAAPAQARRSAAAPDDFTGDLVTRFLAGAPMVILSPDVTDLAVSAAFRPPDRPDSIAEMAAAAERDAAERLASMARGSVCGIIDIQGVARGSVPGRGACGVENAVEVRSIAGVRLSTPAVVDCRTAETLRDWVVNAAVPRLADTGGGLAGIQVIGAYSCRGRNGDAGARLSEHAFGRAIDIGGFTLRNGNTVSVLNGWTGGRGETLRALHRAACRLFGTVLGPNANAAHRDHFHFDTARYRSGSYCR